MFSPGFGGGVIVGSEEGEVGASDKQFFVQPPREGLNRIILIYGKVTL